MWYDIIFKDQRTAEIWGPQIDAWRHRYLGEKVVQTINKLTVIDFDKLWENNRKSGAVLVPCGHDDESIAMGGSDDEIKRILFQSSDGNLNFIASCKCGHLKGNFHLGNECPLCHSVVRTAFADEIDIHAWLEIPETLPPMLHPVAYRVLDKWIGAAKRKASILDGILNVEADLPEPYRSKIGRGGMWYFYNNFKSIIEWIMSTRKGIKGKDNEQIRQFLETYGQPYEGHPYGRLFTRHIPILNQSLHILTHSGSMTYNDESSKYILKTCIELGNTAYQQRHQPAMNKYYLEQHIFSTYKSWIEYTNSVIKDKIQGKTGFIRKCILGARMHASARGVIVPITNTHMADEIELPWRMIVGLYKLEIVNRLILKYGFDTNTALDYWTQAQVGSNRNETDPVINKRVKDKINAVKACLDELLAECPFKGFPVTMGRNPTLRHGALQLFFCKRYKLSCTDDTIGMAPESITAPNADFDGDSLYLASIKEMATVIDLMKIHPMSTLMGCEGDSLSSTVHLIDEQSVALNGYLTDDGELDIDKYYTAIYGSAA